MGPKVKSVLITGANRGIGFHLLKKILIELKPEFVFATFRDSGKSKELYELAAEHNNVHLIQLDVGDYEKFADVTKTVDSVTKGAGLNLLINNAGILLESAEPNKSKLDTVTYSGLKNTLDINFISPVLFTQALLPLLHKASKNSDSFSGGIEKAAVVNVSSILGSIEANLHGGMYAYRGSKAALNAATKSMSLDLSNSGIIAIALHPGWVQTDMGGPNAILTIEQSISGILKVLNDLNDSHNGQFLQWDGKELSW